MPDVISQLRVLVIDDNADNADALSALLEVMNCRTAVAYNGKDGLSSALGFDADLAFIDLEMPGMGGCEVARQLRASSPAFSARLVCLTGRGHPDDRRMCLEAGFDDFFTKPLAEGSLARVLGEERLVARSGDAGTRITREVQPSPRFEGLSGS